jgi:hypothetical protein
MTNEPRAKTSVFFVAVVGISRQRLCNSLRRWVRVIDYRVVMMLVEEKAMGV